MIFKHIEFDKIIEILKAECHSALGKTIVGKLRPLTDKAAIELHLQLSAEAQGLLVNKIYFNFEDISDIWELLFKFRYDNYNYEEFSQIYRNLAVANSIELTDEYAEESPQIYQIISQIKFLEKLQKRYEQIFDPEGNVKDSASPKLMQIRGRIRRTRKEIVSFLNKRADELANQGLLMKV